MSDNMLHKKSRPKSEEDEDDIPPDIDGTTENIINNEDNILSSNNQFVYGLDNNNIESQTLPKFAREPNQQNLEENLNFKQQLQQQQQQQQQRTFDDIDLNRYGHDMTKSGQFKQEVLDIVLYDQYKENKMVFQKTAVYVNENEEIILSFLIEHLKKEGFKFDGALISYFDSIQDLYVYCGQDPLDSTASVPYETIVGDSLEIKVRTKRKNFVDQLMEEQQQKEKNEMEVEQGGVSTAGHLIKSQSEFSQGVGNQKNRVKERKIGEVVEKVALWRRFYTGFFDERGKFISMPLDQAANKVGISKKTLDDYLLQIRCGKKYGFKFNEKLNQRIGVLRTFVKEAKNGGKKDKADK